MKQNSKIQKVLAAVLTITALMVGQGSAMAQNIAVWGAGNDGSAEHPYVITTPEGLDYLATYVNGGNDTSDKYFQLGKDITYTHKAANEEGAYTENNYTAIGNDSYKYFSGTFDGCGKTISGIRIYKPNDDDQGLFGSSNGTVKNVTLTDAVIIGSEEVGGIVGNNYGTIENCHATATVNVKAQGSYAGGIAGYHDGRTISGCTSAATVSGQCEVGGIAGYNAWGKTIENCLVSGANITATESQGGAIVGDNNCSGEAYTAILSRNYYCNCTLTIGSGNNASTATTNIGCGNKATENSSNGTYTPTDVTEMTVNYVTYTNGAVNYWTVLKDQLANASPNAEAPTVITLDRDAVAGSGDTYLSIPTGRHAIIDLNGHKIDRNLTEATSSGYVILVGDNSGGTNPATLVIRDSQGGGTITGGFTSGSCGGISVSGKLTLEGGTITGNKSNNSAAGISVSGTFNMTGGSIINNTNTGSAGNGSAIWGSTSYSHINISGGTITGNKGKNAIYVVGSLSLSGTYDLSGNTLVDGTTAAPDIMLFDTFITINGGLNPAKPVTVGQEGNNLKSLTSGWSTYMSSKRPSDYFVARAYDIANGKVIGLLDDELVLGTTEAVYWHADNDHDGSSEGKAYIITNVWGLDYLATYVNGGNSTSNKYFQLGKDITYTHKTANEEGADTENNFTAIGNNNHSFYGTFDGCGNTISGIRIYQPNDFFQGLFGLNSGTVRNVIVTDAIITGYGEVGGIVGNNYGTIENCHVTATVNVNASVACAGGIVGNHDGRTSGCTSAATVSGQREIGGIAGLNALGKTIEGCLVNGANITATSNRGGAIVGENNCSGGVYNAILSRNYYSDCTLTIGSGNNATTATTNIGCGNKATENSGNGTYTPTDVTEMTYNNQTYTDGAVIIYWTLLKDQLANASQNAGEPTVITLDRDAVARSTDSYLEVPAGRHAIIDLNGHKIDRNMTEAQQGGYVILLNGQSNNRASLTIRDSQGGGQITGGFDGTDGGNSAAGGINVQYGDLTLEGGSICGNKCTFCGGGGVRVAGGTFTMTGGSITGNVVNTLKGAANAGGAIYGYIGDIYLYGGSITDNTAYGSSYACGGIAHDNGSGAAQLHLSGTFTLSGNKKISYNTSDHDWTTVVGSDYLHGNRELIILDGAISPTAPIAIDLYSGYNARLTSNWNTHMGTANAADCFTLVANSESDGKLLGVKDDDIYIGTPEEVYWHADADHDGSSEEKAYIITTTDGLDLLATYVNGGNSPSNKYFQLGKDITYTHKAADEEGAETENNYTAIGNDSNPFFGTFNGNNKTISGIRIYKPNDDYQGLFGYIGPHGTVKDVIVSDAVINGSEEVGGIAGYCMFGFIQDCFVIDTNVTSGNNSSYTGAIVGFFNDTKSGKIENNYYHSCTCTIGTNTATTGIGTGNRGDVMQNNGARAVFTITPASGVSVSGATMTYNNVPYYATDAKVTLSYNGEIAAGYNAIRYVVVSFDGNTDISGYSHVAGYTFSMPPVDLLASVNTSDLALFLLDNDSNRPEGQKNADYIAIGGDRKKVYLQDRTLFKDGDWNTLCLPFSLDAADLAASPLAGATLMELDVTGIYDTDKQTGFDATTGTLYLFFKNATSITAGRPYIIKWAKANGYVDDKVHNVYSPVFHNVTIDNNASTEVSFTGGKFVGNYGKISFTEEDKSILLVGNGNTLFWPQANANLNSCRAYFQLNGLTVGDVHNTRLNFGDENEVNGVNEVIASLEVNDDSWFSLDGRKLVGKPTKKGMYIHGNRKVAVK